MKRLKFLLFIFAFFFPFFCGMRGFFACDQSIVFDGGYRLLRGQIPYRDFCLPFGPVVLWIQAAFFIIFGVNYFAYLLHAAISNLVFTMVSFSLLRRACRDDLAVTVGTLLSSIFFYPQFGTPWFEQTGFFFSLLSLYLLWDDRFPFVAGLFQSLSILSKQNAGLLMLILLLPIAKRRYRFLLGLGTGLLIFAIWLLIFSSWTGFVRSVYDIPRTIGWERIGYLFNPARVRWILIGSPLRILVLIVSTISLVKGSEWPIPGLIAYHYFFALITDNQPENCLPYLGIIIGITIAHLLRRWRWSYLTLVLILMVLGMRSAYRRDVQDIFTHTTTFTPIGIGPWRPLRWGEPTPIWQLQVKRSDVIRLYHYLKGEDRPFFIFPDFTIFYGMVGKPPPQPLLFFDPGLTYYRSQNQVIDRMVLSALKRNRVELVIIEKISYFGTPKRMEDFPLTFRFVRERYRPEREFGIFIVLRRVR
ncbi:hypothetical protein DRP53_04000 [candidate division WOR-3 bacterium]|uniref:Glycosyltransferase RgtA/B/C/D-like domain-containing protein n=1 Tax=candidate division WOR-3 bacterium TaxID=2052148 RepID=A0A660SIR6_UNCW3|nr:MAG: hypothetical protein DRP53_04000 [candidate division WOR-3 bacterium]